MKANVQPRVKGSPELIRELKEHALLLNLMTDGRMAGTNNAYTAAPTTGTHAQGDFVRNLTPIETGAALSRFVVIGWIAVAGGTPGTWRECRVLTGN